MTSDAVRRSRAGPPPRRAERRPAADLAKRRLCRPTPQTRKEAYDDHVAKCDPRLVKAASAAQPCWGGFVGTRETPETHSNPLAPQPATAYEPPRIPFQLLQPSANHYNSCIPLRNL